MAASTPTLLPTHQEFLQAVRQQRLPVECSVHQVLRTYYQMIHVMQIPRRFVVEALCWGIVLVLLIPTAASLYGYWSRCVGGFAAIGLPLLLSALYRTVSERVVLRALRDAEFCDYLIIHGVMRLRPRGPS
jgi:hypothetical protein